MKILYDYQAFAMQAYGGVSRSFAQLISHLPADVQHEIAIGRSANVHLAECGLDAGVRRSVSPFARFSRTAWGNKANKAFNHLCERWPGQRCSVAALRRDDFDIFHPTFFNPYFMKHLRRGKPFVLTVHDLTYEVLARHVRPHRRDHQVDHRALLCPRAAHIVAVSENTAADVMRFYHVPSDKITVIYHGAPAVHDRRSLSAVFDFKYLLYVGSRGSYKNFEWMLRTLVPLLQQSPCRLVCTGAEFTPGERQFIRELGLTDKVVHRFASSDELYRLYNHAELFIYPSLYEGFGIPILEAFANGCPVLLSRASCFPEIGQEAALYFDLTDPQSLVNQASNLLDSPTQQAELTAAGYRRLVQFSWSHSAAQLAQVYRQLI